MLRHILRPQWWATEHDFRKALVVWDNQLLEYEQQSSEKVSDAIKIAILSTRQRPLPKPCTSARLRCARTTRGSVMPCGASTTTSER
eukprot:4103927-Lingulodinium_polyedra.AAC.1